MHTDDKHDLRNFLIRSAMAITTAQIAGCAGNKSAMEHSLVSTTKEVTAHASFDLLKQIDAGILNIGYAELGPVDGTPLLLLHSWP